MLMFQTLWQKTKGVSKWILTSYQLHMVTSGHWRQSEQDAKVVNSLLYDTKLSLLSSSEFDWLVTFQVQSLTGCFLTKRWQQSYDAKLSSCSLKQTWNTFMTETESGTKNFVHCGDCMCVCVCVRAWTHACVCVQHKHIFYFVKPHTLEFLLGLNTPLKLQNMCEPSTWVIKSGQPYLFCERLRLRLFKIAALTLEFKGFVSGGVHVCMGVYIMWF